MAGSEYDSRRNDGARHHPAPEAGRRPGNRGVSAEQDRPMIRILAANQIGRLLARRAARFEEAEAIVRPILEAVRKRGDKAVLEYAKKFDGFAGKSVRVPEKALRDACAKLAPEFRDAVE